MVGMLPTVRPKPLLDPNDTNWGNQVRPVPVANTNSYLYMDAGEDTWGFELVDIYGNAITNWQGLSLSYLRIFLLKMVHRIPEQMQIWELERFVPSG